MNIAIFSASFLPEVQGVTISLMERLSLMKDSPHNVLIFIPDYSRMEKYYPDRFKYSVDANSNIAFVKLPSKPLINNPKLPTLSGLSYKFAKEKLDAFCPDIIHVDSPERLFSGCFMRDIGVRYARERNIQCVAMYHTNYIQMISDYKKSKPILRTPGITKLITLLNARCYNKYDLTLVASRDTMRFMKKSGFKRVYQDHFIGVDINKFKPSLPFKQKDLPRELHDMKLSNMLRLLIVGRLEPDKGWPFLYKALPLLAQKMKREFAVIIVGKGSLEQEIMKKLDCLQNMIFLGNISHDLLPPIYNFSHIYFGACEKETKGMSVLEAAASGLPIVVPNSGAFIETIADGENGLLYKPGCIEDFVAKMRLLAEDADLRSHMSIQARHMAEKNSWESAVHNWLKVLENMSK